MRSSDLLTACRAGGLLAVPAHPPTWLSTTVATMLALCVLVHAWRLVDTRHRTHAPGASRVLVTLPHAGTLVTTVAMTWLVVTS